MMEDNIFENFWRLGKQDYRQATIDQKTVLAHALSKYNGNVNDFCNKRPGMIASDVQKWVNNVLREKDITDKAGRTPVLNAQAKAYIRSLINVEKPESVKDILS